MFPITKVLYTFFELKVCSGRVCPPKQFVLPFSTQQIIIHTSVTGRDPNCLCSAGSSSRTIYWLKRLECFCSTNSFIIRSRNPEKLNHYSFVGSFILFSEIKRKFTVSQENPGIYQKFVIPLKYLAFPVNLLVAYTTYGVADLWNMEGSAVEICQQLDQSLETNISFGIYC